MTMTRPTTEQITHKGQLLSTRLDETFNLKDFGAVGDGVTDDMDALIAAVNAVKATGGTLYIPSTANGYYLRRGTGASLTGAAAPVAIMSDGAILKLQGGTSDQTVGIPVFLGESVNNVRISGLRFEAASTVVRYLNGGSSGAINFDPFVVGGRASATEQTSFRYGIRFANGCTGISIDNCSFGPGIFYPIRIVDFVGATNRDIRLTNLSFNGVNSQCATISNTDGIVISGLVSTNHPGSEADWLLYVSGNTKNMAISDVVVSYDSPVPFKYGGIQFTNAGIADVTVSNIQMSALDHQALWIGTIDRGTFSNLKFDDCANAIQAVNVANIAIGNVVAKNCDNVFYMGASTGNITNVSISDFVASATTDSPIVFAGVNMNVSVSDGMIVDWGSTSVAAIRTVNNSVVTRDIELSRINFLSTTQVPTYPCVDVRGTLTQCRAINCRAVSSFGTASSGFPQPFQAASNAKLLISGCTAQGYGTTITISSHDVGTVVEQLPARERPLVANATTPSVLDNTLFVTANTTATAYTNFTDGVQGQEICIRVNDANTTFDFTGTNLKGRNGVDYTATSGDVIFAKRIGSNWYCTVVEA